MDEQAIVRVTWHGPFVWQRGEGPRSGCDELLRAKGLYQFYGHHVVFGPDSLIYVGRSKRTLGERMREHQPWVDQESGVTVRRGIIEDRADLDQTIERVEALTIWWHSPPYNSQSIWKRMSGDLWVQNHGDRGSLQPEYTTAWVTQSKRPTSEPRD